MVFFSFAFCVQSASAQVVENSTFRLIGTIEGMLLSGAVLEDSTGKQSFYYLTEKLPDGSQVIKVQSKSILLKGPDGIAYEMYAVNGKSTAAVVPYSTSDPFAGGTRKTPAERTLNAYEKRVQNGGIVGKMSKSASLSSSVAIAGDENFCTYIAAS